MPIVNVSPADRAGFLELVNAEIRPDIAKTNAWDDFPVILGPQNSPWQLVFKMDDGTIAGCIACLIRVHKTSCGEIPIAGIGSVVTHPNFRGQGISSALQNEMLLRLKGKNIPLGVLWSDQPEIYAGRGFAPAGWEIHASITDLAISEPAPDGCSIRPFQADDAQEVESLFNQHTLGTVRLADDSAAYYNMPGTQGFLMVDQADTIMAAIFCGKGADFPKYITEWSGDQVALPHLFHFASQQELAEQILIPAGADEMVNSLVDLGSAWIALPSGQWVVIDSGLLVDALGEDAPELEGNLNDPMAWLGSVDTHGQPLVGPLTVAVWGFDSV